MPLAHLSAELKAHLFRLGVWTALSLLAGAVLLVRDRRDGFGAMTIGWALVNAAILGAALRSAPPGDYDAFRRFLAFNLGLNLVWIAIGVAMAINRRNEWVHRAGWAMTLQAVVLMTLDLVLFARTSPAGR